MNILVQAILWVAAASFVLIMLFALIVIAWEIYQDFRERKQGSPDTDLGDWK